MKFDAILLLSFGGPEGKDDVMPFLRNVTRGKNVPDKRLEEVAKHYYDFDGISPINQQNRDLKKALEGEIKANANWDLPVFWGNRNWTPYITDALQEMKSKGIRKALAYVTSAYSSYSGCRQYLENLEKAREEMGEGAPEVEKIRSFFNHPKFIETNADRVREAMKSFDDADRSNLHLVFTAHSIPERMSESCDYQKQLKETARLVSQKLHHESFSLAFQSRSGPPQVPWLEPDICDELESLAQDGKKNVLLAPIGFLSDHMEVIYDLDVEAKSKAEELGLKMVRAGTAGTHPLFVKMIVELIEERLISHSPRHAAGEMGVSPDKCAPNCCVWIRR